MQELSSCIHQVHQVGTNLGFSVAIYSVSHQEKWIRMLLPWFLDLQPCFSCRGHSNKSLESIGAPNRSPRKISRVFLWKLETCFKVNLHRGLAACKQHPNCLALRFHPSIFLLIGLNSYQLTDCSTIKGCLLPIECRSRNFRPGDPLISAQEQSLRLLRCSTLAL